MRRIFTALLMAAIAAVIACAAAPKRVACVGNSITYGYLLENRDRDAYPSQLARLLGPDYEIGNFGHSGATLLRQGHRPYMNLPEFKAALDFRPDIAVIHLGVNDTDPRDWPDFADRFVGDYLALIDSLRAVNPNVEVIIARLTPISARHPRFRSGTRQWRLEIQKAIERVAKLSGAKLIDFDVIMRDRQNLLHDGIHPDPEGASLLAQEVYKGITGKFGPLSLPAVYTSGMVLQRNRPLTIRGQADALAPVTLRLAGQTYRTRANGRGEWKVLTAPLATGGPYTLEVTDGKDRITLTDLQAGELWVASGQSNMEFTLRGGFGGETNAEETLRSCADPKFRVFNMTPVARTDNVEWSDSIRTLVNSNRYFRPARWERITPETARNFSAVAYYFGKMLRDSLNVPVGIILNAVGGSNTESWIDVNTLEAEMPEILVKWQTNDYVQPWCQGRAKKNSGEKGRHPYEPSYLFSSAMRSLGAPDVAGVIWYQGESNAHNTMLHEQLFPLLTQSWRNYFANPSLPFYFVQLSSINRPSWPTFRNSQRLLAERLPNVWMAVSSDHGDSLDVHPRNKLPIGQRLGRQALRHTYGFSSLTPQGPTVKRALAIPGAVQLTMEWGKGMKSSDGLPLRTFELAETEGAYLPASAEVINDSTLIIKNMNIKNPRFVRYGWQPFTRANLVNGEGLPASTMKMEVDNAADFDIEPGMECGVSAPYAGELNGRIIMAGGCNFPVDPLGAGSQKKFYRGIYAADPSTMEWHRIGSLPEGMAYGATVALPDRLVLIGGTTASRSMTEVSALTLTPDGQAKLTPMEPLPVAIDNMAAAVIGHTIYVAGGNNAGTPSRELWSFNLDSDRQGWKRLRAMPGNPRVQPVMAAAKNAEGHDVLLLWGGFAGKHGKNEATLNTDGLLYNPATNRWSPLPAPVDASGEEISLGGGAATTLSNGLVAICGGVNKDIFLSALRQLPEGYLTHPVEWYRFNPNVLLYNPLTSAWTIAATTPDAARAGAAIVPLATSFYLLGGELKPRIRTAQTFSLQL